MTDTGFVLKAVTVRVECGLKDGNSEELAYPGLWAEVRRNLTNGERMELREQADALDARADQITALHNEQQTIYVDALKQAEGDEPEQERLMLERIEQVGEFTRQAEQIGIERFELIAPHIHQWNLRAMNDEGEIVPVPPPREAGAAILAELDMPIVGWLMSSTMQAYRMGFPIGSRTSGAPQEPTPEPSAEKPKGSGSRSRRSPAKSSLPVA